MNMKATILKNCNVFKLSKLGQLDWKRLVFQGTGSGQGIVLQRLLNFTIYPLLSGLVREGVKTEEMLPRSSLETR